MHEDALDEYYELFFRGNQLYTAYAKQQSETLSGLFLMRLLLKYPEGLCQREIARLLGVPKQTMSRQLNEKVTKGILGETPSSSDKREKLYALTEEGRQAAHELIDPLNDIELVCLESLEEGIMPYNDLNRRFLDAFEKTALKQEE